MATQGFQAPLGFRSHPYFWAIKGQILNEVSNTSKAKYTPWVGGGHFPQKDWAWCQVRGLWPLVSNTSWGVGGGRLLKQGCL